MNFGYLIFVSKNKEVDYLKLAYSLAISIKNTQKQGYDKVALVTDNLDDLDSLKSSWVFDKVIFWNNANHWDGRSWMDRLTPWDFTVCLDADMLFFRDHSHVIDYFVKNNVDLFMPSEVYTYRGEVAQDDFYRQAFRKNDLPNVYSMFTYFKKESRIVSEFFPLNRYIIQYPNEFKNLFLTAHKPKVVGTDESFGLSAKLLGLEDVVTYDLESPKIVHLKPMIQNWPWPAETISDHVGFYFDVKGHLKIGNFQQLDIVHYNEKNLITDEIVSILENILWKK
jgi:hypothetical protein